MAPRKEKAVDKGRSEGSTLILEYLEQQNRPYSAIEIAANLHNKVTKTQAVKLLKEMHEAKLIAGKTSGKQSVYHALQDVKDAASPEELATMDETITALRADIAASQGEEKRLRARMHQLEANRSVPELRQQIQQHELRLADLEARLQPLRAGTAKLVSPEESNEVSAALQTWQRRAAARKRACLDLWAALLEAIPEGQSKEAFWEELGLYGEA